MANVYIVSKSAHDFTGAKKFGKLIFLSEGALSRYHVNNMERQFHDKLKNSSPDDFILPCGLSMMNSIACAMFAIKHRKLNLLLFRKGKYVERNIVFQNDYDKKD